MTDSGVFPRARDRLVPLSRPPSHRSPSRIRPCHGPDGQSVWAAFRHPHRRGFSILQTTHATTMSVSIPLLIQVAQANRKSAHRLNMSVKTYSLLKIMVRLLAIAAGIYALSLGADATWTFTVIGLIVIGPDLLETAVAEDGVTISIDDGNEGG